MIAKSLIVYIINWVAESGDLLVKYSCGNLWSIQARRFRFVARSAGKEKSKRRDGKA